MNLFLMKLSIQEINSIIPQQKILINIYELHTRYTHLHKYEHFYSQNCTKFVQQDIKKLLEN